MVRLLSGSCNICVSITHFFIVSHSYNKREQQNWNNEEWQNNWIILIIPDISPAVKIYTKIIEQERKTLNLMADLFTLEANFRFRLLFEARLKWQNNLKSRMHERTRITVNPTGCLKHLTLFHGSLSLTWLHEVTQTPAHMRDHNSNTQGAVRHREKVIKRERQTGNEKDFLHSRH